MAKSSDDSATPEAADQTTEAVERMTAFAERGQRIMQAFLERQAEDGGFQIPDPMVISKAFMELGAKMMAEPQKLAEAQAQLADHGMQCVALRRARCPRSEAEVKRAARGTHAVEELRRFA